MNQSDITGKPIGQVSGLLGIEPANALSHDGVEVFLAKAFRLILAAPHEAHHLEPRDDKGADSKTAEEDDRFRDLRGKQSRVARVRVRNQGIGNRSEH